MQPSDQRSSNLAEVLKAIARASEPPSRASLAASTGLTKPTISKLVETLLANKLVEEGPSQRTGETGRPIRPLFPASGTVAGIGMSISLDNAAVLARDLAGTTLHEDRIYSDNLTDPAAAASLVGTLIAQTCEALGATVRISGITLSIPGRINRERTHVVASPGLSWNNLAFADMAHRAALNRQDTPLTIPRPILGNDARLVARSEMLTRTRESFLLVHGETGIGGTVVVNGQLLHGNHGWAGEIGHIPLRADGPECRCGNRGCLEALAGTWALRERAGVPADVHLDELSSHLPTDALTEAGHWLGTGIASAVNTLDVPTVVVSGFFREVFNAISPALETALAHHVLDYEHRQLTVTPSRITKAPMLVGAASFALLPVLENPLGFASNRT